MSNTIAQRVPFSAIISTEKYQRAINNTLRDPERVRRFVAAITSAVAINPALQECDPSTVLSGALLGESLNLSPSPQLGQYYLVPFENRKKGCKDAQFVLGYKGMIQLALRSGQYKRLNVLAVKARELLAWNPLTEEISLQLIQDDIEREKAVTIGYVASFEYLNGFAKIIYWSREKMESHTLRYSKGYAAKKGYTFWEKDFDAMAFKTMLRQLISKWGIMSIEMQQALDGDGAVVTESGDFARAEESLPAPVGQDEEPTVEAQKPSAKQDERVSLREI